MVTPGTWSSDMMISDDMSQGQAEARTHGGQHDELSKPIYQSMKIKSII